jgi:hypothetical protein
MASYDIQELAQAAAIAFSRMIDRYGMTMSVLSDHALELRSPRTRMRLGFGRYDYTDDSIDIYVGYKQYFHPAYLQLLRNDFRIKRVAYEARLSKLENYINELRQLQDNLMAGCDDLLSGDPRLIVERDRYFEFVKFVVGYGDRETSRESGDWTYLKKPWEEHKRTLPPFVKRADAVEGGG